MRGKSRRLLLHGDRVVHKEDTRRLEVSALPASIDQATGGEAYVVSKKRILC